MLLLMGVILILTLEYWLIHVDHDSDIDSDVIYDSNITWRVGDCSGGID